MSFKLPIPELTWSEFLYILEYLTIKERLQFGCINKAAFIHVALREKSLRNCQKFINSKFLPYGRNQERIFLLSYPRCGNSYLRTLLEQYTGIVTGSDSRSNRPLASSLIQCGFKGEGVIDQSVWIVKSHYPERMGYVKCRGQRILLLVRNPYDAIESYFHMGLTNTHNKTLHPSVFEKYKSIWEDFILNEAKIWCAFYEYWLQECHIHQLPLHIIRYEDLILNKQDTIEDVLLWLMQQGKPPLYWTHYDPLIQKLLESVSDNDLQVKANLSSTTSKKENNSTTTTTTTTNATTTTTMERIINEDRSNIENNHTHKHNSHNQDDISTTTTDITTITDEESHVKFNDKKKENIVGDNIGYNPKQGGIGKGLNKMSSSIIEQVYDMTLPYMTLFGYELYRHHNCISSLLSDNFNSVTTRNEMNFTSCQDNMTTFELEISDSGTITTTTTTNASHSETVSSYELKTVPLNKAAIMYNYIHNLSTTTTAASMNGINSTTNTNSTSSNTTTNNTNTTTNNTNTTTNTNSTSSNTTTSSTATTMSSNYKDTSTDTTTAAAAAVWINNTYSIRSAEDKYGRNFSFLRYSLTDTDKNPLPTI